ncbi:MAG: DUF998 domain-containing protein [Xanthomonadales bacterium]|nr:DUF998 domain-containing protein [Xanthomonadales bacterium]
MGGKLALFAVVGTLLIHVTGLSVTGLDPVASPISALSRGSFAWYHTAGLLLFAGAHLALAIGLRTRVSGWLWQGGILLLIAGGCVLLYVAAFFVSAPAESLVGPHANDPLSVLASVIGVSMAALQRGLWRSSRPAGLFNLVCLIAWLLLIPLILLLEESWIGAYERLVGTIYLVWMGGLSLALPRLGNEQ